MPCVQIARVCYKPGHGTIAGMYIVIPIRPISPDPDRIRHIVWSIFFKCTERLATGITLFGKSPECVCGKPDKDVRKLCLRWLPTTIGGSCVRCSNPQR